MSDAAQTASSEASTLMGGETAAATATTTAAETTATSTAAESGTTATTTEVKAEGEKSTEGTKEEKAEEKPAGAPEKYEDFKLPEGVKLDEPVMGKFTGLAKELNLPQEAAQKLVDLAAEMQQGNVEQLQTMVTAQAEKWAGDAKVDKEFGGDKFEENLAVALRARDQFATPELKQLLNASGLGNHPEVIRFFYRAGQAISQDGFVPGRQGAAKPVAQRMYSNSNMNP